MFLCVHSAYVNACIVNGERIAIILLTSSCILDVSCLFPRWSQSANIPVLGKILPQLQIFASKLRIAFCTYLCVELSFVSVGV